MHMLGFSFFIPIIPSATPSQPHRLHAHPHHLPHEPHDIFRIFFPIRITQIRSAYSSKPDTDQLPTPDIRAEAHNRHNRSNLTIRSHPNRPTNCSIKPMNVIMGNCPKASHLISLALNDNFLLTRGRDIGSIPDAFENLTRT
jgi:hypothetical protein